MRLARVLVVFAAVAVSGSLCAEARHALVIANGAYPDSIGRLTKTYDDAQTMSTALGAVGFTVTSVRDATQSDLLSAISDFTAKMASPDSVGFFYFAGHGAAQQTRGENFILPVGAQIRSSADLSLFAISMSKIMEAIESTRAKASFVVIDACRNVAFTRGNRGLIPVSKYNDMIIAFSTKPGDVAADDGLYAKTLARALRRPGLRAESVFNIVQEEVSRATNREQVPWAEDGLIDAFYFTAARTGEVAPLAQETPVLMPAPGAQPVPEPGKDTLAIEEERFQGIVSQRTGVFEAPDRLSTRMARLSVGDLVSVTGRVADRLYYRVRLEDGRSGFAASTAIERF